MKPILIAFVIALVGFAAWRIIATRVDMSKPDQVAHAFLVALKAKNIDKASKYWLPDGAEAWATAAKAKIEAMGTGTETRFFDDLPDGSIPFTTVPRTPPGPSNEIGMMSGSVGLDLRQINGKWYVSKSPV